MRDALCPDPATQIPGLANTQLPGMHAAAHTRGVCTHTPLSCTLFGGSEAVALEAGGAPPSSLGPFLPRSWVQVTNLAPRLLRRVLAAPRPLMGTPGPLSLPLTGWGSQCLCSHSSRCLPIPGPSVTPCRPVCGARGSRAPSSKGLHPLGEVGGTPG